MQQPCTLRDEVRHYPCAVFRTMISVAPPLFPQPVRCRFQHQPPQDRDLAAFFNREHRYSDANLHLHRPASSSIWLLHLAQIGGSACSYHLPWPNEREGVPMHVILAEEGIIPRLALIGDEEDRAGDHSLWIRYSHGGRVDHNRKRSGRSYFP